jgi:hypothetical protein
MYIETLDSSPIRLVGTVAHAETIDDPIMAATTNFVLLHPMQKTLGAVMDSDQLELIDILIKCRQILEELSKTRK